MICAMDPSILVAGKSTQNYELVKSAFAQSDINIVRAPTMSLSLFLAQKNLPFLIIADTDLVDGDPESFLQGLRSDAALRDTPIVFLTNADLSPQRRQGLLAHGATKILSELKSSDQLQAEIRQFIRWQGKERMLLPEDTTE